MFSPIPGSRHAVGLAAVLGFALIVVSPVRAADSELTRYQTAENIAKANMATFDTLDFEVE
jgi:hypothetical protein